MALKQVLIHNTSITSLDLSNNRIHPRALFELLGGVAANKHLLVLRVRTFTLSVLKITTIRKGKVLGKIH